MSLNNHVLNKLRYILIDTKVKKASSE